MSKDKFDLPVWQKRGVCIIKKCYEKNGAKRSKWEVDYDTPIFSQDRDYIEQHVYLRSRQQETV